MSDLESRTAERTWRASREWTDWLAWARLEAREGRPAPRTLATSLLRLDRLARARERLVHLVPPLGVGWRNADHRTRHEEVAQRCDAIRSRLLRLGTRALLAGLREGWAPLPVARTSEELFRLGTPPVRRDSLGDRLSLAYEGLAHQVLRRRYLARLRAHVPGRITRRRV